MNVAADHVGHQWRRTAIRHVQHVDAGLGLEYFQRQMLGRTCPGRPEHNLARLRLAQFHQVFQRLGRLIGATYQYGGRLANKADRSDSANRRPGAILGHGLFIESEAQSRLLMQDDPAVLLR